MSTMLKTKITGPQVWFSNDFVNDDSWIFQLNDENIAEIDSALSSAASAGIKFPKFSAEHFPLPGLRRLLAGFAEELENGRGFLLLRGLPVDRYTADQINLIYYAIGLHMGEPVGQNPRGDLLGNVMNIGDPKDKNTRVFETNLYLPYHTDPSDVVGLLCLRKAKTGGMSSLVSVASVYNEILENYPEYLGLFYKQYFYAHLGSNKPALSSLFNYQQGKLSCRYLRQYIELGHEVMQHPLSAVEIEALDLFDEIMHRENMRIDMMLEPGDLQFANNYMVLHSRTDFEDFAEEGRRRKMLRLWLKMPNARKQSSEFPGRNGFPVPASVFA